MKDKSEWSKEKRERLKVERRCTNCGKPLPDGYSKRTCEACLITHEERRKRRAAKRKEDRRCTKCGVQDEYTLQGRSLCMECAAKGANASAIKYQKRINNHRCGRCGAELPQGYYYILCEKCKEKDNEKRRRK